MIATKSSNLEALNDKLNLIAMNLKGHTHSITVYFPTGHRDSFTTGCPSTVSKFSDNPVLTARYLEEKLDTLISDFNNHTHSFTVYHPTGHRDSCTTQCSSAYHKQPGNIDEKIDSFMSYYKAHKHSCLIYFPSGHRDTHTTS